MQNEIHERYLRRLEYSSVQMKLDEEAVKLVILNMAMIIIVILYLVLFIGMSYNIYIGKSRDIINWQAFVGVIFSVLYLILARLKSNVNKNILLLLNK